MCNYVDKHANDTSLYLYMLMNCWLCYLVKVVNTTVHIKYLSSDVKKIS